MEGVGYRVASELRNTDKVMNDTFWLGVYPGITDKMISYIKEIVKEFFNQ
jgi:CDP-6-deoxy-D-xylo-4-hexulose-3-dehydrase